MKFGIPSLSVAQYEMGNNVIGGMEDGQLKGFLSRIIKVQFQEVYRFPLQYPVNAAFIQPYETPALGLRVEHDGGRRAFCLVAKGNGK